MRKLTTALGLPQHRFASILVVGTNGKSSVTRMTAALLGAHGLRTGASVSPHTESWSQRTLVDGDEIGAEAWAQAVDQVARAAEGVNRSLEEGDAVTQFEAATAASFVALANARVEVAVIEAGLGGRLDATNTLPSKVTVLTSIGLDHTEWLGESEVEIAAEKLAVLRDQTTLVMGEVSAEVEALAEQTARERGARLVPAPADPGADIQLRAAGEFQRRNFAIACAATEAFLGRLERGSVAQVAAALVIPGRLEKIAASPTVFVDAAHNPDGAAALARSLAEVADGRRLIACLAVLADKDAEGMVAALALAPALDRVVCTELPPAALAGHGRPGARSRPARELAAICEGLGLAAEARPDFGSALQRGRELAAVEPESLLLVTGSHYAIAPARSLFVDGP
ncbi:MAG TPA: cyanophycin synthetase [Solirubrobacterales bacterium]|nr:cyanophycin synthetase [Solirubrobacterales bacterium]